MRLHLSSVFHPKIEILIVSITLLKSISSITANLEENRQVMKMFSYTFGLKMFECGDKVSLLLDNNK